MPCPRARRLFRVVATLLLVIAGSAKTATGETSRGSLRPTPTEVRARVDISPGHAGRRAPDPSLAVWLEDSRGRQLDGIANCRVAVTFNGEPVALAWERTADLLAARVPRRPVRGVLQVEVRAATGRLLARESFELAPRRVRVRMWRHRVVV